MCSCPHCHSLLIADATTCLDCGASLVSRSDALPPALPVLPGVKIRLITSAGQPLVIRPTKQNAPRTVPQQIRQQIIAPCEWRIKPWRDIGVPLIALAFVISFVLGVAAALDVLGLSLASLALLAIPTAGALQAESVWLAGRWRAGLLSMIVWDSLLWTMAVGPLLA